jgi:hypothetical protein
MTEEFNLSNFIRPEDSLENTDTPIIVAEDVKEFIRLIKESYEINCKGIPPVMTYGELIINLNELAGEKLK